jgi:CheY-like chemotaxis protein
MPKDNTLNLRKLSFLVADENPFCCSVIHSILRSFTAESIYEAHHARDADAIMTSAKIDALLCDQRLPGMGGIELARSIRQNAQHPCRSIPILIMAGEAKPATVMAARDAGAHLVVGKPIAPSDHRGQRLLRSGSPLQV